MDFSESYLILIDGYNVIKRHEAWGRLPLREARQQLIELLSRTRWPIPASRVLVIFDSKNPDGIAGEPRGKIGVRYTAPSADAYIQGAIRTHRMPKRLCVISDDMEIVRTARSHGASSYSVDWLLGRSLPRPAPRKREPERTHLSPGIARTITEELAKRWLGRSPDP